MTRIPKIHIEGALYYVTTRGDNNEDIFKSPEDYKIYLGLLRKYKEQYGFKLFAFVLLPNHLCLLVELKEGIILSDIMHDLNGNYTKYFNRKYCLKGHLFQERYKINLLEKSHYLIYMSAYIHLYPQWLNLVSNAADYPYSSYSGYLYNAGVEGDYANTKPVSSDFVIEMKQEIMEVLLALKEKNYADSLRSIFGEEIKIFAKHLKERIVLGSEEFRDAARLKIEAYWQEKYRQNMASLRQCINDYKNKKAKFKMWEEELR